MLTAFGTPSRTKDVLGTLFLVGTLVLYAFQTTHAAVGGACESCALAPTVPVLLPRDSVEPVISTDSGSGRAAELQESLS